MSGFGSSILIEAAPPLSPACFTCNAGWLYFLLVALTSTTAEAESSSPSSDVNEDVAIVVLLCLVVAHDSLARFGHPVSQPRWYPPARRSLFLRFGKRPVLELVS